MSNKILVTCGQMQVELPHHLDRLRSLGYDVVSPMLPGQQFTADELLEHSRGVVGMIAGDDELSRKFLEGSPALKVLVRWGIGMDTVDHRAAAELGIVVRNTPGVFGQEVADMAFGYILGLARGINYVDNQVRAGQWPKFEGTTLAGSVLGVIGYGNIGRQVAARARGFGMQVLAYDPYLQDSGDLDGVTRSDLKLLLSNSQFVVTTCPLTNETHHIIDEESLSLMRSDAYLINVGRGPLVNQTSLEAVLQRGAIRGAALDVFEAEPLPETSLLREFPNVILGAHNGSNTRQGVARASTRAVDILLEELAHA